MLKDLIHVDERLVQLFVSERDNLINLEYLLFHEWLIGYLSPLSDLMGTVNF